VERAARGALGLDPESCPPVIIGGVRVELSQVRHGLSFVMIAY
jgi:hypothetical protein